MLQFEWHCKLSSWCYYCATSFIWQLFANGCDSLLAIGRGHCHLLVQSHSIHWQYLNCMMITTIFIKHYTCNCFCSGKKTKRQIVTFETDCKFKETIWRIFALNCKLQNVTANVVCMQNNMLQANLLFPWKRALELTHLQLEAQLNGHVLLWSSESNSKQLINNLSCSLQTNCTWAAFN